MKREAWLDGKLENFSEIKMPAAHALAQAKYEIENAPELSFEELNLRPNDISSAAFQLKHIAGSIDRLLTYARGENLTEKQFEFLKAETSENAGLTFENLQSEAAKAIDDALEFLKNTPEENLFETGFVGREKLATNVFGLLFHIAEHTARHVGQFVTTAKIVKNETKTNLLIDIQNWYESNCNGDWEHEYGISIENADNPGWIVKIDLNETDLENKHFREVEVDNSDNDWIFCKVEDLKFVGYSDTQKLEEILQIFLEWSKK